MEALTEVVRAGKARYLGFSEWPAEKIDGGARAAGRREVRLEPAAVLDDLARARARRDPALRGERHLADRLVAARAGRPHGQVQARPAAARGQPRDVGADELLHGRERRRDAARARAAAAARSRTSSASRWRSSRSRGCCASRTSPRRSSARRGPQQVEDNAAASGVELDAGDARADRRDPRRQRPL